MLIKPETFSSTFKTLFKVVDMDAEFQGYYDDIYLYKLKTDKHIKKAKNRTYWKNKSFMEKECIDELVGNIG